MVVSNADAKKAGINGFNNGIAGYPVGQCTGFVASILRANKVPESKYSYLGNGNQWAANAKSRGIKVDMKPSVGAVVSFKAYGSSYYGAYGHVAYITKVNSNGSVHLYEGNFSGLSFHERDANIDSAVAGVIHFSDGGGTTTPPKPNTKDSAAIQEKWKCLQGNEGLPC
ncbi:CHAP domain-containing protein [Weissella minor]|uniref:CHAP domain-containing protein n=1 Tax=Weissella minor TaxID=1620 RepID=UPI001BB08714|nr:CHAP domain-containing protein [Weissella minor]MBS0949057.1 CHAP domain-containing protein [Weissella minor]